MTEDKSTVVEGNKIIAEFLGWEYKINSVMSNRSGDIEIWDWDVPYPDFGVYNAHHCTELKFHSSWDWQVPAWSKLVTGPLKQCILSASTEDGEKYNRLMNHYGDAVRHNNLLYGFQILVGAIEWYNSQSKTKA